MRSTAKHLTQGRLKSLLHYDPATGIWTYAVDRKYHAKIKAGAVAGCPSSRGYLRVTIDRASYELHTLAFFYMTGRWPDPEVDHENCDPADNRWVNLREATRRQQLQNTRLRSDNKSGFKGVSWCKQRRKWKAVILTDGSQKYLGHFTTPEAAADAYKNAADAAFGPFARS